MKAGKMLWVARLVGCFGQFAGGRESDRTKKSSLKKTKPENVTGLQSHLNLSSVLPCKLTVASFPSIHRSCTTCRAETNKIEAVCATVTVVCKLGKHAIERTICIVSVRYMSIEVVYRPHRKTH